MQLLKLKYRTGRIYKKSRSDPNGNSGKSHRNKLNAAQRAALPPQPARVMVVYPGGRKRMETV